MNYEKFKNYIKEKGLPVPSEKEYKKIKEDYDSIVKDIEEKNKRRN